jgi:hypothetical protein
VPVGAALHAAKITLNPIAALSPKILKVLQCVLGFMIPFLGLCVPVEFAVGRSNVYLLSIPVHFIYLLNIARILILSSVFSQAALGNLSWHSGIL